MNTNQKFFSFQIIHIYIIYLAMAKWDESQISAAQKSVKSKTTKDWLVTSCTVYCTIDVKLMRTNVTSSDCNCACNWWLSRHLNRVASGNKRITGATCGRIAY